MTKLLLVCGVLFVSTVGFAKSRPMPFSACVDEIYAGAGARSMEEAKITCRMQNDERFVQCAVDKYNDLDYSYTSEQAIGSCLDRFPGQSIHTSCVTILGSAGFKRMDAIDICDETTDTLSLAIPKCIYRQSRSNSDNIVADCRYAFERGQLNEEGYDKDDYARIQREQERRRQQEIADRRAANERAEAQKQRQAEIARQKAQAQRDAEAQRQRDIQARKDRLALERAENEARARRAELDRQEARQRAEARRQQEKKQEVRQEPRQEPKRVETKKDNGVSQADKARRAEEIRRQEEQRNWEEMVREEKARKERERQKQDGKKQKVNPVPKEDIPPKKKEQQPSEPVKNDKKQGATTDNDKQQGSKDEGQNKATEGRDRVERAKKEAEERRKQQERQEKEKKDKEKKSDGGSTDDVPPPPTTDEFTDFPNPYG